jgi:hypothetical protein
MAGERFLNVSHSDQLQGQPWWYRPVISVFRKLRRRTETFIEATLGYRTRLLQTNKQNTI